LLEPGTVSYKSTREYNFADRSAAVLASSMTPKQIIIILNASRCIDSITSEEPSLIKHHTVPAKNKTTYVSEDITASIFRLSTSPKFL
jgi:hypothetical protein